MALSWNEIKERAVAFSKEWEDTFNEEAEAKPFLEVFFNIFRRQENEYLYLNNRIN